MTRIFYLPILRDGVGNLSLHSIIDPSPSTLARLDPVPDGCKTYQGTFEAYFSQLKPGEIDAVVVALPHHLHESAVISALRQGLNVFCEKPLGLTADSVLRIQAAERLSQGKLVVCQPRRSFPAATLIRNLLETHWLGAVQSMTWNEGQPYAWPAESLSQVLGEHGGGELIDIGAHAFDLVCWWFGRVQVVKYSDDAQGGTAGEYRVGLSTNNDITLYVNLSRLRNLSNEVIIQCELGKIRWDLKNFSSITVNLLTGGRIGAYVITDGNSALFTMAQAIKDQLGQFAAAIQGVPAQTANSSDALNYAAIFDACRERQTTKNRTVVKSSGERSVVVGASGFIGGRLVETLFENGRPVTGIVRRPQSCVRLARLPSEIAIADMRSPDALSTVLRDGGDVIYLSTVATGSKEIVWSTIVDGTRNVLRAAEENNFRRIVIFSSMLAYGDPPPNGVVDESSRYRHSDMEYAKAKQAMERECSRFAETSKLEVIILEPTCVFGPYGKDFGTAHVDAAFEETFVLFNEGRGTANLIYVDNLVDAAIAASKASCQSGAKFILNEEEFSSTWIDYFSDIIFAGIGVSIDRFPSLTLEDLEAIVDYRSSQRAFPQVFRNAVRNHVPSQQWLSENAIFQIWKRLKKKRLSRNVEPVNVCLRERTEDRGHVYSNRDSMISRFRDADKFFLSPSVGKFFASSATYSSAHFRRLTGWHPIVSRSDAMRHTCDWIRNQYETERNRLTTVAIK